MASAVLSSPWLCALIAGILIVGISALLNSRRLMVVGFIVVIAGFIPTFIASQRAYDEVFVPNCQRALNSFRSGSRTEINYAQLRRCVDEGALDFDEVDEAFRGIRPTLSKQ